MLLHVSVHSFLLLNKMNVSSSGNDKVTFIPGTKGWLDVENHHITRIKVKNHMIISMYGEKVLDKIQHSFTINNLSQLVIEGNDDKGHIQET